MILYDSKSYKMIRSKIYAEDMTVNQPFTDQV